jgi:putative peptidoglycan lipid II flippase
MAADAGGGTAAEEGFRRGTRAVAGAILLSRLTGLVRERVLAQWLGTGLGAEAFRAALRIPNVLQNLLGDGVLGAALVPSYARLRAEGRDEAAGRLAAAVAALLLGLAAVLTVLGVLLAAPLTRLLVPGFPPGTPKFDLTVQLVRIIVPGTGLLVLSAWALSVLTAHRRFFRAYVAPVLWNAAIVAAGIGAGLRGFADVGVARAVATGAVVGAALQLAVQLPAVRRHAPGALRLRRPRRDPDLRAVLRASRGAMAARGVVQLSASLDLIVASLLAAGAVAALGYAQVLHLLPISLFGMSAAAVALPELATSGRNDPVAAARRVQDGLRRVTALTLPVAVAYVTVGDHVVGLLYRGGAFGAPETRQVAAVLAAYAVGLAATVRGRVLQAALHALDDTRTPARAAALRVAVGTVVGIALMLLLDAWRLDPGGPVRVAPFGPADLVARASTTSLLRLGAVGLGLGAAVGAWTEVGVLRRALARRLPLAPRRHGVAVPLVAGAVTLPAGLLGRWLAVVLPLPTWPAAAVAVATTAAAPLVVLWRTGVVGGPVRDRPAPRRGAAGGRPAGP